MADLMKPADAARALSVSVETMKRWIRAGRIPCVKVGGRWRIPASYIEQLAEEAKARRKAD